MAASVLLTMRSDDEILPRDRDHYRSVRFRNVLVHGCSMPLPYQKAWRKRNRPRRIVEGAVKNEQIKFFCGKTDGRNSAARGVGWISRLSPIGYEHYAPNGGGTKPPNSFSINSAKAMVVRSSRKGPMICIPIGKPRGVRSIGAAVEGSPHVVAGSAHT
jgi:hypothetical protein